MSEFLLKLQLLLDSNVDLTGITKTKPTVDNYMLSHLTTANEFFKLRVLVRFKDFHLLSRLETAELEEIDKSMREDFWRVFSLLKIN